MKEVSISKTKKKKKGVKNKKGQYYCGFNGCINEQIFSSRILDGLHYIPTSKHCREEIKYNNLKDCKIVKVKIEEVKND